VASSTQMISRGRRVPFFRDPLFRSTDHPWAGFSFEEAHGDGEPLPKHAWPKTTLLYVTGGDETLDWKHRGVWTSNRCQQGTVSIMRREAEIESAVPSGPMRVMALQLDDRRLQKVAPDYIHTIEHALVPVQVVDDLRLTSLLSAMLQEVREGCPSGRLYGEAISLALLAFLAGNYATHRTPACRVAKLSATQVRGIVDYVKSNITRDIAVTDMARLVEISPSHFSRIFRQTFGDSPYHFVMQQRVEEAKRMLTDTKLSSSQVGAALGFASQSHFVKVFRRFTGVSPRQYRVGL
jgi:AraC family transcriptional regulator